MAGKVEKCLFPFVSPVVPIRESETHMRIMSLILIYTSICTT